MQLQVECVCAFTVPVVNCHRFCVCIMRCAGLRRCHCSLVERSTDSLPLLVSAAAELAGL